MVALVAGCRSSTPGSGDVAAAQVVAPVPASDFSVYDLSATWQNQQGDTLQLSSLKGRIRVVAMVYTNCHSTCPLIVAELKRIEAAVPPARIGQVGFVLVSIDPTRDTPERLSQWARDIELDTTRWTVLTGNSSAVRELAATLDVRYQQQPTRDFSHTNGLTVLDRDGRIVHQQPRLGESQTTTSVINSMIGIVAQTR